MTAQIRITYPDGRTEERVLAFGTYIAGREVGDIVLGDPNTSGRHAQIDVQPGRVVITDLGSTNGTFDMQGQRLGAPYTMFPDQPVRLGTTTITLMPPQKTAAGTQVMPQMGGMPGTPAAPYSPPATAPYPQPGAAPQYGQPPGATPSYGQPAGGAQFGQPPAAPFGQPPGAAPSYGQAPSAPFGQPPGAAPYAQPPPGAPYGQPPGAAPYGQPAGPPYGQPPGFTPGAPIAAGLPIGAITPGNEAQWGARVVGFLIDYAFVVAVMIVLTIAYTLVTSLVAGAAGTVAAAAGPAGDEAATAALGMFGSSVCAMLIIFPLATLSVGGYNRVYLVSKRGYSIGQGVMKLKVVDANGALLPMGTAALRLLAQVGLGLIGPAALLDLLWPLWDPRRQTLHDKIVGSFVVPDPTRQ